MRSLLSPLLSMIALVSATLVSSTAADETVVHLPEDAAAGQSLGDLRELLRLAPTERAWLEEGHEGTFRIDARDRLVVAPRAAIDHESQPQHRLTVRIIDDPDSTPRRGDPLQTRFKGLISDPQEDGQQPPVIEDASVRTAIIRILIDDVAEPPVLLGSRFRVSPDTPPRPGQRIGRAIAIDLDREEQHHFELLDSTEALRIDPDSGELFLHEDVNPLSLATLQAVVRVTDRAGLSAQASYRVWLNDNPPAPPLPFRIQGDPPATEKTTPVEVALASASATPPPPPMPHVVTETTSTNSIEVSASDTARHAAPAVAALRVARPRTMLSDGPTWLSPIRELLSSFGLGRFEEHRREWLIVAAVLVCVAVIVISGVRDAVVAGREVAVPPPRTQPAPSNRQDEPPRTPAQRRPQEISEILERLDAVIGKGERASGDIPVKSDTAGSTASTVSATEASTVKMRTAEAVTPVADMTTPGDEPAEIVAAATTEPARSALPHPSETVRASATSEKFAASESAAATGESTVSEHADATQQASATGGLATTEVAAVTAESAVTVYTAPPRQPQRNGTLSNEERERIEQFREISRMMNRADIGRHHRERMRDEWLSVGVTSLACVVTGTVCVFTSCFGTMSVPLSSVMFSIATVLLMRPSLYPQFAPYDAATSPSGAKE